MSESVIHIGAVTMRIVGQGNLDMSLKSLDDIKSSTLRPFTMTTTTAIEPTRLANFKSQRIKLRISTNEIDEFFVINRIVLWVKEIYKSLPSQASA